MGAQKVLRWGLLAALVLALILGPFFFFGARIEAWTDGFLQRSAERPGLVALVLGGLLASDIVLPVPSSVASTAAGYILGFVGGTVVSLVGMSISCVLGYGLGFGPGRPLAARLVGESEITRLEALYGRLGDWVLVVTRPIPVLAEASVPFAGISRMPLRRFTVLTTLSNLGISAVYAIIGAFSATLNAFLLAFAGSILLPWLAWLALKAKG